MVHKVQCTETHVHVQKKRKYLDKGSCHAWDSSGASLRGGVHVWYRLGCVCAVGRTSLPAGKAFLSTASSSTVSHCKASETCRSWVRGSEPCEHHCLAGENLAYHSWCAWAMDSVPYPARMPSDRHQMNIWALNGLWNFLTLPAVYYLCLLTITSS